MTKTAAQILPDDRVEPRYVSPKQAAQYRGLSVFSIYRLVERRAIPFIPLCPSGTKAQPMSRPSVRFDVQALDAWMKKQTTKPVSEYVDERTTNE
jgi:predicted DNA-binding transcriptional regulator AlpA